MNMAANEAKTWIVTEKRRYYASERGAIVRSQLTERGAKRVAAQLQRSASGNLYLYEAKRHSEY